MPERLLVLFDVDGTLLLTHDELVGQATSAAIVERYGIELEPGAIGRVDHAGQTQKRIVRALLRDVGLFDAEIDARLDRCCAEIGTRYLELLAGANTSAWASPPGTLGALESLSGRAHLALLTGNPEPIARSRMERLGLARFFPPGVGAFGCEREDRRDLIALARERAGDWPADRTVEVGDTPADVASAKAVGIRSVAVCWGRFGREELRGADAYVHEMPELVRSLRL